MVSYYVKASLVHYIIPIRNTYLTIYHKTLNKKFKSIRIRVFYKYGCLSQHQAESPNATVAKMWLILTKIFY